jgi:hypothetical protein
MGLPFTLLYCRAVCGKFCGLLKQALSFAAISGIQISFIFVGRTVQMADSKCLAMLQGDESRFASS